MKNLSILGPPVRVGVVQGRRKSENPGGHVKKCWHNVPHWLR